MSQSKFYTNIFRSGKYILVKEVNNGKRKKFRVEYQPTLYVPTNKQTNFHTTDNFPVLPIQPGNMQDCYQFMQKYKDIENFKIYGNTAYEYAYINEEYPGHVQFDITKVIICTLDIEVEYVNGYSEAKEAKNPVISITAKDSTDGSYHVFACKPFINKNTKVTYYQCHNEVDLFEQFLDFWEKMDADILTFWNGKLYDLPYIINRMKQIMDEDSVNRLSPWGIVRQHTENIFNKPEIVYDIAGVAVLDYMLIYKKNVLEPRESYKLDYIAQYELQEGKVDYGEYETLQNLYEKNFELFLEYNIRDVELIERIDKVKRLIEQQMMIAYHAKVNYQDVFSQLRTWDTHICNHLLAKNIVIPQKQEIEKTELVGAYVFPPIIGMHKWIVTFDVQSLYPTIMRTVNMGIESKLTQDQMTLEMKNYQTTIKPQLLKVDNDGKKKVNIDVILKHLSEEFLTHLQDNDVSVAVNGEFYRRNPKSFYSEMIQNLFESRLEFKKKTKEAKNKLEELKNTNDLAQISIFKEQESTYDLRQHSYKIMLNSLYGALGSNKFRYYSVENAEAVTTTGQFISQYVGRELNKYVQTLTKNPSSTYLCAGDTDSLILCLDELVQKFYPNKSVKETTVFLDKLCKQMIQPEIDRLLKFVTERYLNGVGTYLWMNREIIGDKAIWTAKKHYIISVVDKEGIYKDPPSMKFMGVEIKKAMIPKFCRDAMEEAVKIVLYKEPNVLYKFVEQKRKEFEKLTIEEVCFSRSVNGIKKYHDPNKIFGKKTPYHTKAALFYNHVINQQKLTKQYQLIRDGDKIKFFFVKEPNPMHTPVFAYSNKVPKELDLYKYVDYETQWQKSFVEPMMLILNAIGWDIEERACIDSLFDDTPVVTKKFIDYNPIFDDTDDEELIDSE